MQLWNVLHTARWNTGRKNCQKFAIYAPSHNFVGLYLRNWGTYRQSEKNPLNSNVSLICPHNMVNLGPLAAEICWRVWGTPANFNGFRAFGSVTARHSSSGRQPNFAALNRGRHLYSARRPSRWALATFLASLLLSPFQLSFIHHFWWPWVTFSGANSERVCHFLLVV